MAEDTLKNIRPLKASLIVLSEGGKVGNRLCQIVTDEPTVGNIDFDLLDCLSHAPDPVQVLDKYDLEKNHGVYSGVPPLRFFIKTFHLVIDKAPIQGFLDLAKHMILRNEILYTQHLQLGLLAFVLLSVHEKHLPLRYPLYHIGRCSSRRHAFCLQSGSGA